jgi:hypothetical protein
MYLRKMATIRIAVTIKHGLEEMMENMENLEEHSLLGLYPVWRL